MVLRLGHSRSAIAPATGAESIAGAHAGIGRTRAGRLEQFARE